MKLRNTNTRQLLLLVFALESGFVSIAVGQTPVGATRAWANTGASTVKRAGNDAAAIIRAAAEAVRDAKDSKDKEDAQKKLADVLSKCYDEDMAQREKELTQVEERLKKLRELLERRRAKKQEIIELQTKVALNEAEGLGFYDGERSAQTSGQNYYYSPRPIQSVNGQPAVLPDGPYTAPRIAPPAPAPGMGPSSAIPR